MDKESYISLEIRKLSILIKRIVDNNIAKNNFDVPSGIQSWVLRYLYKNRDKDIFQRNIEKQFSIRRSSTTSMLQCMEKRGLIMRQGVDYDARLKKITLTPKAIKAVDTIEKEILEVGGLITKDLTEEEIKSFNHVISKIIKNLSDFDK